MATWKIDQAHSHIGFKLKHLVVSTVKGEFKKYDATMEASADDFSDAKITFEAEVSSISTGAEQRDGHLQSDDFFNSASYPKVTFVSTSLKKVDGENYKLTGNFTMRDKTLPITLDVVFGGAAKNPFSGKMHAGFELKGKVSRKDYGLKWNAATEAGGMVVSDDVHLDIAIEMTKQD